MKEIRFPCMLESNEVAVMSALFPFYASNIRIPGKSTIAGNRWTVFSILATLLSRYMENMARYRVISWIFSMY